jgi:hypothetical protein
VKNTKNTWEREESDRIPLTLDGRRKTFEAQNLEFAGRRGVGGERWHQT